MDNRFKVGDRVRVVKVSLMPGREYYHVGDVMIVTKIDDCTSECEMRYKCTEEGKDCPVWVYNQDIEAEHTYRVGQKIRLTENYKSLKKGDIAEIIEVDKKDPKIPVRIKIGGIPFWIAASRFELLPDKQPVIVITSDGKETKARLMEGKKTIREATARCSDDDKFDFETGAKIAFDKLIGRETKPEKSRSKFKPGMVCKVVKEAKNVFGTAIVQPGDFVEIKSIDGERMTCHGFSRAEQRFTDNICLKDDVLEAIS